MHPPQWGTVCANPKPCKIPLFLNSPIHQAKTNISVPGRGQTPHGTGSAIGFGGWTLESKVALLVTPQNAKTAIMQSWHTVLPWLLFLNYAASATDNTQSSFTGAEIRRQWEVSSNAKISERSRLWPLSVHQVLEKSRSSVSHRHFSCATVQSGRSQAFWLVTP